MIMRDRIRLIGTISVIICAAAFICYGIAGGEPLAVMKKAVIVCLECIGIG